MSIPPMTHARLDGPLVMVGFGSIGKGALPPLLRRIDVARDRMVIIDPDDSARAIAEFAGIRFEKLPLLPDTLRDILTPLLRPGGFLVNLSVGVSSVALIELCRELGALYLDTCVEPPPGGYTDPDRSISERSNHAMRESALALRRSGSDPTAAVAHGANPGMVSHLVKRALLHAAHDLSRPAASVPREDWARLARDVGVTFSRRKRDCGRNACPAGAVPEIRWSRPTKMRARVPLVLLPGDCGGDGRFYKADICHAAPFGWYRNLPVAGWSDVTWR